MDMELELDLASSLAEELAGELIDAEETNGHHESCMRK